MYVISGEWEHFKEKFATSTNKDFLVKMSDLDLGLQDEI
jgi:hypothetical protein